VTKNKNKENKNFLTIILLIFLVIVWSSVWSLFKIALEEIPPLSFRVLTGIPAAILLFMFVLNKKNSLNVPKENWKSLLLISFFNVTLWQVLMLYGLSLLGGGRAAVLAYTMPVWATISAGLIGYEKINLSVTLALIFGMIGIFSLSIGIGVIDNLLGLFLTLSAGLSWGIGTMIVKYGGFKSDGMLVAGWQQLIGVLPIIPFAIYFDTNKFGSPNYTHYLIIIYAIIFSSAYTYWAYFTVLQKFSVNVSSLSVMMVPVLAILIDYLFMGVFLTNFDIIAVMFIISSIFIAATKPFNKKE
jgi:drug/metabolite transporter (DMT)-like permease